MPRIFEDWNALVVGGTGGIGRYVSRGLAERGAALTVTGFSHEHLERAGKELAEFGKNPRTLLLDFNAEEAAGKLLAACPQADILVCSYGPFFRKPLARTAPADWARIVSQNLTLPGSLVSAYIGGMTERRRGRILLFGGTNTETVRGRTTTVPYAAAKTALAVLAKSAAKIGAPHGVTCNVICPGLTDTEYVDAAARDYNAANSPAGAALRPEDIAPFAITMLENPHLNGAVIALDDGADVNKV